MRGGKMKRFITLLLLVVTYAVVIYFYITKEIMPVVSTLQPYDYVIQSLVVLFPFPF